MTNQTDLTLVKIKENLEAAAFLVSRENSAKETHSHIMQALYLISELKLIMSENNTGHPDMNSLPETARKEINRVQRKLKLWAKRQNQINSRILNAYLSLKRDGKENITVADIETQIGKEITFHSNFTQMRNFGEKNHGKIFDLYGDTVSLWEPVEPYIREYEEQVFGGGL